MLSPDVISEVNVNPMSSSATTRWRAALQLSWLGQMVASVCWIVSVFAYGVSSVGDMMQLLAASAWAIANLAALRESSA